MNNNCTPLTEFDKLTLGNSTQMLKAIVPFFDFNTQRILSMFIRIWELITTVNFYRNRHHENSCRKNAGNFNQNDFFNTLCMYCPDINMDMVYNFNTFMQMENIMSENNSFTSKDTSGFDMAQNMMNPEQQKSYEKFLKELENLSFESEEEND